MWNSGKKALVISTHMVAACGGDDSNNSTQASAITCSGDVCTVKGELLEDTTFTADKEWVLSGGVFVGNDTDKTVLTIEPGTTIYGASGALSFLTIRRGSQLNAQGTANAPIVFTSAQEPGSRARGDWGGLIINGRAPINSCDTGVCEAEGEGGTGLYGGDDPTDSSGALKYVRVEFAGALITSDNELNGIAFQGVGSGTVIDFIQVHMNKDDGIEFFGGNAQAKHVVITGAGVDSIDWTDGWQGKIQYAVVQQYADSGDNGIEADNNGDNNTASPRSNPTLTNLTIVGVAGGQGSDIGVLLREGTSAHISNTIVTGFNDGCLQIDGEETFKNAWMGTALSGELEVSNTIVSCATNFIENTDDGFVSPFMVEDFFMSMNGNNVSADPMLENATPTEGAPNFAPKVGSPAIGAGLAPADSFFDTTDYIGAIGSTDWTTGWTIHDRN